MRLRGVKKAAAVVLIAAITVAGCAQGLPSAPHGASAIAERSAAALPVAGYDPVLVGGWQRRSSTIPCPDAGGQPAAASRSVPGDDNRPPAGHGSRFKDVPASSLLASW
jgi:hypothetical protein